MMETGDLKKLVLKGEISGCAGLSKSELEECLKLAAEIGNCHLIKELVEQYGVFISAGRDAPLCAAVGNGHLEAAKLCVELGAVPHVYGEHPLFLATSNDNLELVQWLLDDCHADVHRKDDIILRVAAEYGSLQVFRYFIEALQLDIRAKDDLAIIVACEKGSLEIIKYLFTLGLEEVFSQGKVLEAASSHVPVLELLLEHGIDINGSNCAALKCAAAHGNITSLEYLLENGADIHVDDDAAVREACSNNQVEATKFLLKSGANPNANQGELLIIATSRRNDELVSYLIDHGADPKVPDPHLIGFSKISQQLFHKHCAVFPRERLNHALVEASLYGDAESVAFLLHRGADPKYDNDAAIQCAAESGSLDVIKLLVGHGADIRAADDEVMVWAANYAYDDIIKYCLENGCNPNAQNGRALRNAAFIGSLTTIKILLDAGCPLNNEAIVVALEQSHFELAKFLLGRSGVDLRGDGRFHSLLMDAAENSELELVRLLIEKGADCSDIPLEYSDPDINECIRLAQASKPSSDLP